jgi:hypothetical protein
MQAEQDPRLEKALEHFIRELMQHNHDIKEQDVHDLVKTTMNLIGTKDDVLGLHQLQDPAFVDRLTLTVLTVHTFKDSPQLQDELKKLLGAVLPIVDKEHQSEKIEAKKAAFLDEFIKMLQKTDKKDMEAEFQKLLDKYLSKEEQATLAASLKSFTEKLFKEASRKNPGVIESVNLKPEDINASFLNLLSPNQTGSIPIPVVSYGGNAQGITDQSSRHFSDNMAWVDKPIAAAGETVALEVLKSDHPNPVEVSTDAHNLFHQSLKDAGFQTTPTLTPPSSNPSSS